MARAALGQGAAHHQRIYPAQHDREGGNRHADEGRDRVGGDRDEEDHGGLSPPHGDRHPSGHRRAPAARAGLPWRARVREMLDRERVLGPLFITPAMILIALLVAYPFCIALYFAVSNAFIGRPSHFIGLTNFVRLWDSDAFRQTF